VDGASAGTGLGRRFCRDRGGRGVVTVRLDLNVCIKLGYGVGKDAEAVFLDRISVWEYR
jgi:hypothetical protein